MITTALIAAALAAGPSVRPTPQETGAVREAAAPGAAAQEAAAPAPPPRRDLVDAGRAAAQVGTDAVGFDELDRLLLARHALGPVAEEALRHMAQVALIHHLGDEAGIQVTEAQVRARFEELDRRTREAGVEGGLEGHLLRSGVDEEEFRRALRDQLVLAELTRRALGLSKDAVVPEHDQQIYLDQQMAARELVRLARPWQEGVVARLGEIELHADDLALRLRDLLGPDKVRDALFQLALLERVERAVADLPAQEREAAVAREVESRRAETDANPAYQGVSFEALLRAQGLDPQTYQDDPAVRIAALSTLAVDVRYAGAKLEEAYRAEQQWFDDRFGESVRALVVFVATAERPDGIVRFTREGARARLREVADTVDSEPAFAAVAAQLHQDATNGIAASDLGRVHRADTRLDGELSRKVFELHEAGVRGVSGPVELSTGVGLFWIGEHRPTPDFEGLRDVVHTELRRRFLVDLLPARQLVTYLDPAPGDGE